MPDARNQLRAELRNLVAQVGPELAAIAYAQSAAEVVAKSAPNGKLPHSQPYSPADQMAKVERAMRRADAIRPGSVTYDTTRVW